jgi:glycosyltransferase involved in cell wall biosynthesis
MNAQAEAENGPSPSSGNKLPLVAIVTPVYNGGKFLERSLRSVQAQTYPNIVHIVLNNASKDNSAEIINRFVGGKVKVEVYTNPETIPLADNWSKAFSYVPKEAAYVKWLCADDLIRHDCIERFVEMAEANPGVEIALSHTLRGDVVRWARLPGNTVVHNSRKVARLILEDLKGYMSFHHFFLRMRPEYRVDDFFGKYWAPDPHVVIRCALKGQFGYIPEPLVFDRYNPDSVTVKEINSKGVLFQLVNLHLHKEFDEQVYGSDAAGQQRIRNARAEYCTDSARYAMRWRLAGQGERAKQLEQALAENGFKLSLWHYVAGVLTWPLHSLRYRLINLPRGEHIDEATYTSSGAGA